MRGTTPQRHPWFFQANDYGLLAFVQHTSNHGLARKRRPVLTVDIGRHLPCLTRDGRRVR